MGLYSTSSSSSSSSDKNPRYWTTSKLKDKMRTTEGIIDSLQEEIRQLEKRVAPIPRRYDAPRGDKYEQLAQLRADLKQVRAERDDAGERLNHAARAVRNPLESREYNEEARYESRRQAERDDRLQRDEKHLLRQIEDLEDGRIPAYTDSRPGYELDDDDLTPGQKELQMKRRLLRVFLEEEKAYKLELWDRGGIKTRTMSPGSLNSDYTGRPRSPSMRHDSIVPRIKSFSRQTPVEPKIVYHDEEESLGRLPGDSFRSWRPPPVPYDYAQDPVYSRTASPRGSYSPRRHESPTRIRQRVTTYRVLSPAPSLSRVPSFTRSSSRPSFPVGSRSTAPPDPFQYLDSVPQASFVYNTPPYTAQQYQTPSPAYSNIYRSTEQRLKDGSWATVYEAAPSPYTSAPTSAAPSIHSSYGTSTSSKAKGKNPKKKKIYIVKR